MSGRRGAVLPDRSSGDSFRLLVLSHVLPVPGDSGQQQRVRYTLEAARRRFHVTLAACVPPRDETRLARELGELCDEVILIPKIYERSPMALWTNRVRGAAHALARGVKRSNHAIGSVELSPARVAAALGDRGFDAAIFEYWHASESTAVLNARSVPCLLDMHNVLWAAYDRQLRARRWMPDWLRSLTVSRYRRREEDAWRRFDGLIAINREEETYVRDRTASTGARVFYAPMGIALERWPYQWSPARPLRIGFYGGLSSPENQEMALRTHSEIMPGIWRAFPDAELWLVGAAPPESLRALARDPRVRVTGFVPDPAKVLASLACVVCPWKGRYGFRSRLVEVMSVGVPVVASADAVAGMELENGQGILLAEQSADVAAQVEGLLRDPERARLQSRAGRKRIEALFTAEATYGRLMDEIHEWLVSRRGAAA